MRNTLQTFFARFNGHRLLPLAFFIVLPALAVRTRYVLVAPDAAALWPGIYLGDIRSWWKAALVIGIATWMAVMAAVRALGGWRPRFTALAIRAAPAAAAVVLSAALSSYSRTAWLGYTAQYEGALALLAYLAALWYTAEMTEDGAGRLWLVRLIGMVALVNAGLGIMEGMGWQIWRTDIGSWLMGADPDRVTFYFDESRMAYGTLFQPNHYGMFMAMAAALSLGMAYQERERGWTAFWQATCVGGFLGVVFSNSRMAFGLGALILAGWAAVGLYSWLQGRNGATDGRFPGAGMKTCLVILGVVVLAAVVVPGAGQRLVEAGRTLAGRTSGTLREEPSEAAVDAVLLNAEGILVRRGAHALTLRRESAMNWMAVDVRGVGSPLVFEDDSRGWRRAPLPGFVETAFTVRTDGNALLTAPGLSLRFFSRAEKLYVIDDHGVFHESLVTGPADDLFGMAKYLGGRGYIWSRSLPLIAKHFWFGSGPGAFALVFPNDDLVQKQRYLHNLDADKGHGVWMTFAVQLGVAGFILFALPFVFAMSSLCRYREGLAGPVGLALAVFLLGSATNDSTVGVTPIFCVLAGLAFSEGSARDDNRPPGEKQTHAHQGEPG